VALSAHPEATRWVPELHHNESGMDTDSVRCLRQVYVRAQDAHRIFCAVGEKDLAPELLARFKHETEEKERKRKDKAEAHLNTMVKIARDEDLTSQIGHDIFFDLVDHDKVPAIPPAPLPFHRDTPFPNAFPLNEYSGGAAAVHA
jgi:hypothetical protein